MNTLAVRNGLPPFKSLVVKVGSRIVTAGDETACRQRVELLVHDIAAIRRCGISVILVSSGAIAHGMRALNLQRRPKTIPHKQACASIGQIHLMHTYEELFGRYQTLIGQVLLTWDDMRHKERYLNLRNALFQLLEYGAVPIINENDSVGVEEIRFGDNDTLGAQIALLAKADLFVNLTDINGLYDANPAQHKNAKHIPLVASITPAIHRLAGDRGSEMSVGGMKTKLRAADMVTRAGICAMVGDGYTRGLLKVLADSEAGTLFLPLPKKMGARACWLAFSGQVAGVLTIDAGAERALVERGKSLLPAGVITVTGGFKIGDTVEIKNGQGLLLARGLVNYSAADIGIIKGCKTVEIEQRLGQKTFDEVIHRDNLVRV